MNEEEYNRNVGTCPLCGIRARLENCFCLPCTLAASHNLTTPQIMLEKKIERENRRLMDKKIKEGGKPKEKGPDLDGDAPRPAHKHLKLTKEGRREYLIRKCEEKAEEIIDSYRGPR